MPLIHSDVNDLHPLAEGLSFFLNKPLLQLRMQQLVEVVVNCTSVDGNRRSVSNGVIKVGIDELSVFLPKQSVRRKHISALDHISGDG